MGQIHAALVTDAKCKSGLLRKQLTQINSYQTEGLFVCMCIFGTCDAGQVLQQIQFLPQMVEERLQFGMTSPLRSPSLIPCIEIEHCWNLHVSPSFCRRLGHSQNCGLGDISFLGRSWELEVIHCASGRLQTAE